tara:strand:+ start:56005 stop:56466 length:462 start_codon:yes stop_codon:yes gene_type:complete
VTNNHRPISELLAHRPPMVLIDELIAFASDSAHCQVTITPDSAFYQRDIQGVQSYIGSEYMAQSIAAYAGAHDCQHQRGVKIGFLLGSRKIRCLKPIFKLGSTLDIYVTQVVQDESGLSVFDCAIECDNERYLEAKINVFQPADPMKFIKENQ